MIGAAAEIRSKLKDFIKCPDLTIGRLCDKISSNKREVSKVNIDSICDRLSKIKYPPRAVYHFPVTDSTNRQARLTKKERDAHKTREYTHGIGEIFIADGQSAGRGRLDRRFVSVMGAGLYFTVRLGASAVKHPEALTPTVAVATAEATEALTGAAVGIKWVNDLYLGRKKLAGILCESHIDDGKTYYLIGIGINLRSARRGALVDEIATDLEAEGYKVEAEGLLAAVYERLLTRLSEDIPPLEEYRARSVLTDRRVLVSEGERRGYYATVRGIAEDFSLSVVTEDGEERQLSFGEVSLKIDNYN